MEKKNTSRWLRRFIALALAVLALLALAVYIIDPYYHYRAYDNKYKLDKHFVVPGVVMNYEYDSILIGSSVVQNTDMEVFRQQLGGSPIKATLSGISATETLGLIELAQRSGRAERYYICVDVSNLSKRGEGSRFPEYLTDENPFNDYKYFWGYEAWMRFIPLNLALVTADKLGIELPQSFKDARSIDKMNEWADRYEYKAQQVIELYADSESGGASVVDMAEVSDTSLDTCDWFIDSMDLSEGEYTFFFPPYSALTWYDMQRQGGLEDFLSQKQHFIERMAEFENVRVFDFQAADFTLNLDNYMDMSHYSPEINDLMVCAFASGDFLVNAEIAAENAEQIRKNIPLLLERYPEIQEIQK